jgi:phosphatidate cytidylyltransferase
VSSVNPTLLSAIVAVFVALTGGTLVRIVALRGATEEMVQSRLASLRTWWVLAGLLALAVVFGKAGVAVILAIAAATGLNEFVSLVGREQTGVKTLVIVFLLIPIYYCLALSGYHLLLLQASPMAFVLILGGIRSWLGLTQAYIRTSAAMVWGLMLFVICLSCSLLLFDLPVVSEPPVGRVGWFLYLVILTEINDIMQAITGRRFGRTKITPRVSPNKSLEGLLGGISSTMLLAVVSAPWLTTLTAGRSPFAGILVTMASGLLISLFGFLGDINMSAIKRDAGVKDGSTLLPGQGGMIDRIDSLTFTAPAFYYFVQFMMKAGQE